MNTPFVTLKPPYYAVVFTSIRTEGDRGYSEMKKLPYGISDFKRLKENNFYYTKLYNLKDNQTCNPLKIYTQSDLDSKVEERKTFYKNNPSKCGIEISSKLVN